MSRFKNLFTKFELDANKVDPDDVRAALKEGQEIMAEAQKVAAENADLKAKTDAMAAQLEKVRTEREAAEKATREAAYASFVEKNLEKIGASHASFFKKMFAHLESMPEVDGQSAIAIMQKWMETGATAKQAPAKLVARDDNAQMTAAIESEFQNPTIMKLSPAQMAAIDPVNLTLYNQAVTMASDKKIPLHEAMAQVLRDAEKQ